MQITGFSCDKIYVKPDNVENRFTDSAPQGKAGCGWEGTAG